MASACFKWQARESYEPSVKGIHKLICLSYLCINCVKQSFFFGIVVILFDM